MRLAVFAALRWECRAVLSHLRQPTRESIDGTGVWRGRAGDHEVWLVQTGVGPERAERSARRILNREAFDLCLSTGCAGALAEGLMPGAVVIATDVVLGEQRHSIPSQWSEQIEDRCRVGELQHQRGTFFCSPRVLATQNDKAAARRSSGAIAVEMEGGGIATAAAAFAVPFAAVRTILDSASADLPESGDLMNPESGGLNWRRTVRQLASPSRVGQLLNLGIGMRAAERSLNRFFKIYFA